MLFIIAALTISYIKANNHAIWLPPKDGKAFYADFLWEADTVTQFKDYDYSRKHTQFLVGDSATKLNLWVTTMESNLGIVTT